MAEVGNVELYQLATLAAVTVSRESESCYQVMSELRKMAGTLAEAELLDMRAEVQSRGEGGSEMASSLEMPPEDDDSGFGPGRNDHG